MKDQGMPFGAKGPEGMEEKAEQNNLNGAKGGGMKHVVSPGAGDGDKKKHMIMMALMRAAQGGPPQGGMPMGAPPMPMGGGMGGGY